MNLLQKLGLRSPHSTPVILASEISECGLACMAMVARRYGHEIDLNTLRQRYALSLTGATLRNLIELGDQLKLAGRAVRLDLDGLARLSLPAILHWDFRHFVVLTRVTRTHLELHDPSHGKVRLSRAEASKHFTGIALELLPAPDFEPIAGGAKPRLTALWSRSSGLGRAVVQVLLLSAMLQLLTFVAPFQLQLVVDEAINRGDADILLVLVIGFGVLGCLQVAVDGLRNWTIQLFGNLLTYQLIGNVVRHLLRLPTAFFEKRHLGDILSRVRSTQAIQDSLTRGLVSALIDGIMALLAGGILFFYSPLLAAVAVLSVAVVGLTSLAFYPAIRMRTDELLSAGAREQSFLMESIRAAHIVKLMGREAEREGSWRNLFGRIVNANIRIAGLTTAASTIQTLALTVGLAVILYVAASKIIHAQGFSVGMLLAFLAFRQTFTDRSMSFVTQASQLRLLGLHMERLQDIVGAASDRAPVTAQPRFDGAMRLDNVAFRYGQGDPLVLKDIDLEVKPGEFIAIKGPSGGGKTTLIKLMLGLAEPTEGEVRLGEHVASPALWRVWRQGVSVVAQDDALLSGSIADNIAFFDPDLDMDRVHRAAEAAQVHHDITRMPMQYLSPVGDMGSSLSGGQRQRVLLARALYRQPRMLFLDEGTANLDEHTEEMIGDLISSLDITRIVVAHRPALLRRADRLFSLADGRLVEIEPLGEAESTARSPSRRQRHGATATLVRNNLEP